MTVDRGPTSAEKSNVYVSRHLVLYSYQASTACFATVIRVVSVNVETHAKEDLG